MPLFVSGGQEPAPLGSKSPGCAARELWEETGLQAREFEVVAIRDHLPYTSPLSGPTPRHYLILGLRTLDWSGEPTLREPDRCAGWEWVGLARPPQPLFRPAAMILAAYRSGRLYIPGDADP